LSIRLDGEHRVGGRRMNIGEALGGLETISEYYGGDSMRTKQAAPKNIDDYIAGFPDDIQEILQKIRLTIRKAAPDAEDFH
jgi:hypothetical protein